MGVCERSPHKVLMLSVLAFAIPALCAAQSKTNQVSAKPVSPAAIYERAHSSVALVIVGDRDAKPIGQGSGFIVARDRVATNHHVIEGAAGFRRNHLFLSGHLKLSDARLLVQSSTLDGHLLPL
jgi:S1-C subfamily serine protease